MSKLRKIHYNGPAEEFRITLVLYLNRASLASGKWQFYENDPKRAMGTEGIFQVNLHNNEEGPHKSPILVAGWLSDEWALERLRQLGAALVEKGINLAGLKTQSLVEEIRVFIMEHTKTKTVPF